MTDEIKIMDVLNAQSSTMRQALSYMQHGVSMNGERDLNTVFGYTERTFPEYMALYRKQDIAGRIVAGVSRSCWRSGVTVQASEDDPTPVMVDDLDALTEAGVFLKLERADILNRIGRYSVLVVGVPDGAASPEEPLGTAGGGNRLDQVYFMPYAQDGITVVKWVTEVIDPRYGKPEVYQLEVVGRTNDELVPSRQSVKVHWSRIVHMAEGCLDNDLEGTPALEPVANRLDDLNKAVGGSAEAYFRNARGKMALELSKDFQGDLTAPQKEALQNEADEFTNNQRDFMRLRGTSAKVLNTPQADPEGTVKVALQMIMGATGYPMRVLTGEGSGQLAGSEDKLTWNQIVSDRQNQICAPWFWRVLEILQAANMLTVPEGAVLDWPITEALSEKEAAEVQDKRASALEKVARAVTTPGFDSEMTAQQAIEEVLGLEYKPETDDGGGDGLPPADDNLDDDDLTRGD